MLKIILSILGIIYCIHYWRSGKRLRPRTWEEYEGYPKTELVKAAFVFIIVFVILFFLRGNSIKINEITKNTILIFGILRIIAYLIFDDAPLIQRSDSGSYKRKYTIQNIVSSIIIFIISLIVAYVFEKANITF